MDSIVGIDPGASGSLCYIFEDNSIEFIDFKTNGLTNYITSLKSILPQNVLLEKVHSFSRQGVKSMFSFGQRLGELEGMLQTLNLKYSFTTPQKWQKFCGVVPKSGKKGVYTAISTLYPNAPLLGPKGGLLDGRCDALGIAHYLKHNLKT